MNNEVPRKWSNKDVDHILHKAWMHLVQTAASDGTITDEEQELLETFDLSLKKYRNALTEAVEDGIITEDEEERLLKLKDIMIKSGTIVADNTGGISKDELNMLMAAMLSIDVPKKD